jgi:hypothetical protein
LIDGLRRSATGWICRRALSLPVNLSPARLLSEAIGRGAGAEGLRRSGTSTQPLPQRLVLAAAKGMETYVQHTTGAGWCQASQPIRAGTGRSASRSTSSLENQRARRGRRKATPHRCRAVQHESAAAGHPQTRPAGGVATIARRPIRLSISCECLLFPIITRRFIQFELTAHVTLQTLDAFTDHREL